MDITKEDLKEFKSDIIQAMDDKSRIDNDILRQEIKASEQRTKKELEAVEKRILDGVTDILGNTVLPQIDELDYRVTRLEAKTARL